MAVYLRMLSLDFSTSDLIHLVHPGIFQKKLISHRLNEAVYMRKCVSNLSLFLFPVCWHKKVIGHNNTRVKPPLSIEKVLEHVP